MHASWSHLTAAVVVAAAVPFLVYYLIVFGADPFWSVPYGRQNVTPSPPPLFLAAGVAPLLVLAVVGLAAFLEAGRLSGASSSSGFW